MKIIDTAEIERIGGIKNGHNPDIAAAIYTLELNGLIKTIDPPNEGVSTKAKLMALHDDTMRKVTDWVEGTQS